MGWAPDLDDARDSRRLVDAQEVAETRDELARCRPVTPLLTEVSSIVMRNQSAVAAIPVGALASLNTSARLSRRRVRSRGAILSASR